MKSICVEDRIKLLEEVVLALAKCENARWEGKAPEESEIEALCIIEDYVDAADAAER